MELPPHVELRSMTADDIPAGLALCRAAGWNQLARDWELFLRLEPEGATVASSNDRVIGTVTTLHFGSRFGWIAMVLVDPSERGKGIGRALLLRGLSALADVAARLDATPAGEPLYRTLGFEVEYSLTRLQRDPAPLPAQSDAMTVAHLTAADWPDILALDANVFGADRSRLLRWLDQGAPEYAYVSRSNGSDRSGKRLQGFMLGRHGQHFDQLGPIVAQDTETARWLVGECLAAHGDRRFVLDAPDHHTAWHTWLRDAGFSSQRPFARMFRGRHLHPGDPRRLFASVGPEFG